MRCGVKLSCRLKLNAVHENFCMDYFWGMKVCSARRQSRPHRAVLPESRPGFFRFSLRIIIPTYHVHRWATNISVLVQLCLSAAIASGMDSNGSEEVSSRPSHKYDARGSPCRWWDRFRKRLPAPSLLPPRSPDLDGNAAVVSAVGLPTAAFRGLAQLRSRWDIWMQFGLGTAWQ